MIFITIMLYDLKTDKDLQVQVIDESWTHQDEFTQSLAQSGLGWREYYGE